MISLHSVHKFMRAFHWFLRLFNDCWTFESLYPLRLLLTPYCIDGLLRPSRFPGIWICLSGTGCNMVGMHLNSQCDWSYSVWTSTLSPSEVGSPCLFFIRDFCQSTGSKPEAASSEANLPVSSRTMIVDHNTSRFHTRAKGASNNNVGRWGLLRYSYFIIWIGFAVTSGGKWK